MVSGRHRADRRMPDEAGSAAWNFLSLKGEPAPSKPPQGGPTASQPAASPWSFLAPQQQDHGQASQQKQRRPPGAPPPPPPTPPPRSKWDGHDSGGGGGNVGAILLSMVLSAAATAAGIHWRAIRDRIQQAVCTLDLVRQGAPLVILLL